MEDEVEITGIGRRDRAYDRATSDFGTELWDTGMAAQVLEELARRIREDGPSALLMDAGTTRFESALRSFLAGYLSRGDE